MLADKTLLSVTLAVTFTSGLAVGFAAKKARPAAPADWKNTDVVCAKQLRDLEGAGYDASELAEAKQAYSDCLKGYDYWWTNFLDMESKNLDLLDAKLEKRLAALAAKHAERGTK
jgi:hypothetical protein